MEEPNKYSQAVTEAAFLKLVASGGHQVNRWATEHEADEQVLLFGNCVNCMTELQLLKTEHGEHPSLEAARPCPAITPGDDDWDTGY